MVQAAPGITFDLSFSALSSRKKLVSLGDIYAACHHFRRTLKYEMIDLGGRLANTRADLYQKSITEGKHTKTSIDWLERTFFGAENPYGRGPHPISLMT